MPVDVTAAFESKLSTTAAIVLVPFYDPVRIRPTRVVTYAVFYADPQIKRKEAG